MWGLILSFETSERAGLRETAGVFSQILGLCGRLGVRQSRIFLTRFACKPVSSFKWFRFLAGFRRRHGLGCPHDDLMRKKPYKFLALGLPGHRGFDLLVDHFNLAAAGLPREMLEAAWRGRAMDIGQVNGRRDAFALTMRLSVHSGTSHEGAFSIRLTRQSDRLDLVRLSFILYPLGASPLGAGRYTVAIGGLQGSKEPEAKRAVIDATRDLCGLRPKDAALLVMEGIAMAAPITSSASAMPGTPSTSARPKNAPASVPTWTNTGSIAAVAKAANSVSPCRYGAATWQRRSAAAMSTSSNSWSSASAYLPHRPG